MKMRFSKGMESSLRFNRFDSIINAMLPMCFFSGTFVSLILAFYGVGIFGENENLRILVSGVINGIIVILLFIKMITLCKNKSARNYVILPVVGLFLLAGTPFIIALTRYGISFSLLLQLAQFLLFSTAMCLTAVIIVIDCSFAIFIKNFRWYGLLLMPFAFFYIVRFYVVAAQEGEYLYEFAGMSYMTLSYTFFPILFYAIYDFLYVEKCKMWKCIDLTMMVISWILIVYSGTRGAVVCVAFLMCCFLIYDVTFANKYNIKRILLFILFMMVVYMFSTLIWSPSSSGSNDRLKNFDYDQEIYTSDLNKKALIRNDAGGQETMSFQDAYISYYVKQNQNISLSDKQLRQNMDANGKPIFSFVYAQDEEEFKNYVPYIGRAFLYSLSLEEYKKAPLLGNGVLYFQNKYNNYPHNLVLEVLCDMGAIGIVVLLGGIGVILYKLYPIMKKNMYISGIVLLCFGQIPSYMLSGSSYLNYKLLFSIAFSIACILSRVGRDKLPEERRQYGSEKEVY